MERKLWHEQQTQKCALTSIGLLIEGLSTLNFPQADFLGLGQASEKSV